MTVLTRPEKNSKALEKFSLPVPDDESMQAVLTTIHYDLSLDPTKTGKQVKKRMSDLATTVNHTAKSLKTTRDRLKIREAVQNEEALRDYLAASDISHASRSSILAQRNTLLRYARRFGFSPASFTLLDEWDPVLAELSSEHGEMAIAKDAILRKRRPIDLSNADLAVWADATLMAGRTFSYVRNAQAAFLTAIRKAGLESHFPLLDVAVRKPLTYKLPMTEMAEPLRDEITRIIESRRHQAKLGAIRMAPATESELIAHFEDLCGYAARVCGMENLVSLRPLLVEGFINRFAFWMRKERRCKRTTVVGRLSRMFSSLATSPDFRDQQFGWIYNVYRKLRPEPESALKERRRQRHVEFQELAAVPGRMFSERTALTGLDPKSLDGWRVHDELLLTVLIIAQWPPRFVRLAELGRNVFKGPIPKDEPPFSVPSWAEKALCEDPNAQFWQFHYKSLTGELHRGLILRAVVPLLEMYLEEYRRLLVRPHHEKRLFCNRRGHVLSNSTLGNLVSYRIWHYLRKRTTLTAIRSSFAYYWRQKYPNKDAVLSQIQWVDYATTKMRYDEEFRRERALRVYRRKNRYA